MLVKQMSNHKLLQKAEELWKQWKTKREWTREMERTYETIDTQFARAVAHADKKCRQLFPDTVKFSPEVRRAVGRYALWREMHKKIERKERINSRWVINFKNKWDLDEMIPIPTSKEECEVKKKMAWEEFKTTRSNSEELRDHFLDLLIKEAEEDKTKKGIKKTKELKSIRNNEKTREAHTRIGQSSGKGKSKGIKFIHREKPDGTRETVTDKFEMVDEIMKENEIKLNQSNAKGIPLRDVPLIDVLTKSDYEIWEAFIQGEIEIPEGLEEGTVEWLKKFKGMDTSHDIEMECDHTELTAAWNKVKESTSSLPHPCHYGTMKTMKWCEEAAKFHTIMANIPLVTGYSPESWQHDVEAMLQKKEGEWRPQKLRRISLLHPAFNMNNRRIGRMAMKAAEERGLLAEEQFGSRKERSAEKHALNKRLMLDVMRVNKTPGILSANDAKSCYDRILHFATYVSLRRVGVPKEAIISMIETLRKMKHKVRTAYGDSANHYGGEDDGDPHGALQGNAGGPAIWALVSSPLLDILREKGYGAKFVSAIKKEFFHMCGFAFVDDTDTVQTAEHGTPSEELIEITQEGLDLWESLIRSTGGAIVGEKSDYTVINWVWKEGKPYYEKTHDKYKLTVRNEHGTREELKHLPVHEARRTLGVWQAADGNEKMQTKKLKEKTNKWANSIAKSSLKKSDVRMGVQTSLYPAATYGLMATTLSQDQAKEVFGPIRAKVLPKMKICRTVPATLVHGPTEYGGMGIKDLYTLQGIAHIKVLIEEGNENSATGKLIRNLLENHALEIGIGGDIFQAPFQPLKKCITESWFKSTLEFISENDIEIESPLSQLRRWKTQDTFIMEDAMNIGMRDKELAAVNRCRMHLKATTVSDITTEGPTRLTPAVYDVIYDQDHSNNSARAYRWPHQPRPPLKDRRVWKQFLRRAYNLDEGYLEVNIQEGAWTRGAALNSEWIYSESEECLMQKLPDNRWAKWKQSKRRRSPEGDYCRTEYTTTDPPDDANVAVTSQRNQMRVCLHTYDDTIHEENIIDNEEDTEQPRSLQEHLNQVDKSLQWLIEDIDLPEDDGATIAQAILTGNGKCMSDGSLKDLLGTSACTFITDDGKNTYIGRNVTPGEDDEQNSYRSELCGILTNMILINAICDLHGIDEPCEITVGCDSESALWNGLGDTTVNTGMASLDIVHAVRHQKKISPLRWKRHWVKGHQDDIVDEEGKQKILDEWGQANVLCDKEAESKWNQAFEANGLQRPNVGKLLGESWLLRINDRKRSTNLDEAIYAHVYYDDMIAYWVRNGRIQGDMAELIDWEGYKAATKAFKTRQIWLAKHFSGWAGSGTMMHKWKQRDTKTCHRCDKMETTIHVTQCQHPTNIKAYQKARRAMKKWMEKTTSMAIMTAVLLHMDAYQQDREIVGINELPHELRLAATYQRTIGPRSFGEGLLSHQWQMIQKNYCRQKGGHETSKRWVSRLIQHIWEISWTLWDNRNDELHTDAKIRRGLYSKGIMATIESLKVQATFCLCLTRDEIRFFQTESAELEKRRERSQLDWIARAEQFLDSERLSKRLLTPRGNTYFWLAGNASQPRRGQQRITDHMHPTRSDTADNDEETTDHDRTRDEDNDEHPTGSSRQEEIDDNFATSRRRRKQTQTTLTSYFTHKRRKITRNNIDRR